MLWQYIVYFILWIVHQNRYFTMEFKLISLDDRGKLRFKVIDIKVTKQKIFTIVKFLHKLVALVDFILERLDFIIDWFVDVNWLLIKLKVKK